MLRVTPVVVALPAVVVAVEAVVVAAVMAADGSGCPVNPSLPLRLPPPPAAHPTLSRPSPAWISYL